jgi:ATP-binding cassette subfamily B protein
VLAYDFSPEDGTAHRARLKNAFDRVRSIHTLTDKQVAEQVLEDEIDVLVDLHGLSSGARPGIFALHPAPKQGTYLGFIGTTGAGKSTLLDIVMGLLSPTEGALIVDGQSIDANNVRTWQRHIAHVPQSIYLTDSSLEENIAFGVPIGDIDRNRIRLAASQAQISDVIENWPMQYKTKIGERGIRLSGGQRQRIGIARALYKQSEVIIFDEATSALDSDTEQTVMDAVDGLHKDLTVLIIAHRLTTLKNCNLIVELEHGTIKRVGQYSSLVNI